MKKCTKCHTLKSKAEFHHNKNGIFSWCKECIILANTVRRQLHPWLCSWYMLRQRCNNKKKEHYQNYGGKGIRSLLTQAEIEIIWFRDKAGLMAKPSIDRIDKNGNYEFGNCRFIEQPLNSKLAQNKTVIQCDLNGNFIREWESQTVASNQLNMSQTCIGRVCLGKRQQAYGFIWKFKGD